MEEVYIIPTNCEKGYLPEILIMIGDYVVEINKRIERYQNFARRILYKSLGEVIPSVLITKDKNFLSKYPSIIDVMINACSQPEYVMHIADALTDIIISQYQTMPEWDVINLLITPKTYYGIAMDIKSELRWFLINEYYLTGTVELKNWTYLLISQYNTSLHQLYGSFRVIRKESPANALQYLKEIFTK